MFDADGKNPRVLLSERADPARARRGGPTARRSSSRATAPAAPSSGSTRLADRGFRRLAAIPHAMGGVYSPDGSRDRVHASRRRRTRDVWVMNADGSGAKRLTREPALDLSPTWSPDGKRLAFVSDRAGTPQIYVMGADGSSAAQAHLPGQLQPDAGLEPARRRHRLHGARRAQGVRRLRRLARDRADRARHAGPGAHERGADLGAQRAAHGVQDRPRRRRLPARRVGRARRAARRSSRRRRRRALGAGVGPARRVGDAPHGRALRRDRRRHEHGPPHSSPSGAAARSRPSSSGPRSPGSAAASTRAAGSTRRRSARPSRCSPRSRRGARARRARSSPASRRARRATRRTARSSSRPRGAAAGLAPEVISGDEEARLVYASAWRDFGGAGPLAVLDVGGGSTEFTAGDGPAPRARTSLQVGAVRLTERHVRGDPPRCRRAGARSGARARDGARAARRRWRGRRSGRRGSSASRAR